MISNQETLLPTDVEQLSAERTKLRMNRRAFASTLAAAGVAATAASTLAGCSNGTVPTSSTVSVPSVVDVLNFALNLEYFEANFYTYLTTGSGLPTSMQGSSPGTVSGAAKVSFVNPYVASVAQQLATDEQEHVTFLRNTITAVGGTPVSMPTINFAAGAAITSDATFLAAARQFETVGISAYAGGAQYLVSNTTGLTYAAQILHVEAQHEGFLRELCIALSVTSPVVDSLDLQPTSTAIFNTNAQGLNAVRTPSQVLQILFAAPGKTGVTKGGFFPNGIGGNLAST